eukprot:TRINITY_DN11997_c0_g2_i6.p4 TRINITY_DN11997_c0_g2~~TRINITY_DN11997_c0_g2_i6.p4  ORF type:complete len:133 (-),score=23.61 TRINITY_DN11997_c0_g2_i6:491-889(-)
MRNADIEALLHRVGVNSSGARTGCHNFFMALLVDRHATDLTSVTLLAKAPAEAFTKRAKRRLLEENRRKAMPQHHMDLLPFHSPAPGWSHFGFHKGTLLCGCALPLEFDLDPAMWLKLKPEVFAAMIALNTV